MRTEQPSTFTAPETGSYHFVTGQEPHLVRDCTEQCQPDTALAVAAGSTVGFMNSAAAVQVQMEAAPAAWDHE